MPNHVPTAAQLAQQAVLKAAQAAAIATFAAAKTALANAQVALNQANTAYSQYHAFIFGGKKIAVAIDEGGPDVT